MDLHRLHVFRTIAGAGTLSRASVELGSTTSLLSRQLAALERDFGGPLFLRTGRGLVLSELGTRVLPRVTTLLQEAQKLSQEVDASRGIVSGVVRLGIVPSLVGPVLLPLVRQLRVAHPGIRLNVLEGASGQLDAWRAAGLIDMAVLFRHTRSETGDEQVLGVVDNYLVGPAGDQRTNRPTVPFVQLAKLPLLLPGLPNGFRIALDHLAGKHGVELEVMLETNSLQVQAELVRGGQGYSIMGGHAAAVYVAAGTLQAARIVDPVLSRTITLALSSAQPAGAAIREVARLLRVTSKAALEAARLQPG